MWVDLGCLITAGLSKGIRCHVLPNCSERHGAERERSVRTFGVMYDHIVLNSMVKERDNGNIKMEGEGSRFGLLNDTASQ